MLISPAAAQDRWVYLKSDGFEMFTNAGARAGRVELVRLEQLRYTLGRLLGKPELAIKPPAQVYFFKSATEAAAYDASDPILKGREHVALILSPDTPAVDFNKRLAKLLIESNTDRMPADIERGLIALMSTAEVSGIRVTLGKPVPAAERDKAWARMHMLAVDPESYGRLPVLLSNLGKGADEEPSYRNAYGKSKAEIEAAVDKYFAAGNFPTSSPPSRPMSVERDFPEKPLPLEDMQLKLADLKHERELLAEYAKLLAESKAGHGDTAALERAILIAPTQAEPRFLLAQREKDPKKRIELLKVAIALDRRNASYWAALGEAHGELHDYPEAAKAWRSAEQAAATPAERERMRNARLDVERQRLDWAAAEKKRVADANEAELKTLKETEIAKLRALEAQANKGGSTGGKVEQWWTGPQAGGKTAGTLQQVDCLGKQARLIVRTDDGKMVRLAVRDASQIAIVGAKEQGLGCGRQKPRKIVVEYFPKPDAKLTTAGDVATIEFPE
jgi:tetratricopeptide (TPR) repeat protein